MTAGIGKGMTVRSIALAICAALMPAMAASQIPPSTPDDDLRVLSDRIVGAGMAAAGVPRAIVAISRRGRRWYFAYGSAGTPPLTRDSIVEIGSITKVFTTTLLAEAFERGAIDPRASIQAYLPGVPLRPCTARITTVELADFSSGLPRLPDDLPQDTRQRGIDTYTPRDFVHWLSGATPRTGCDLPAPYLYSNASIGLLGIILGNATGRPWHTLIADDITTPLGMADTAIAPTRGAQVEGYYANGQRAPRWPVFAWYAAGALRSTAQDMMAFGEAALDRPTVNGRAVPPVLRQAFRRAMRPDYRGNGAGVGLAWETLPDGTGGTLTYKNGGTDGFSSVVVVDRDKDCTLFVVADKQNAPATDLGLRLMRTLSLQR